jgi:hypothetical protein
MNDCPWGQVYKGQLSVEEKNNTYKQGLVVCPKRTTSIFS